MVRAQEEEQQKAAVELLFLFMEYLVYILHSEKLDRFYTGYTSDLERRLEFHTNAEAQKFTAKANDWNLFFSIKCLSKEQALQVEKHIKKMKGAKYIHNLARYPQMADKLIKKYNDD